MSTERIRPPRPYNPAEDAPEQPDQIAKLAEQEVRAFDLFKRRGPLYERYGMGDRARLLQSAQSRLVSEIRERLAVESEEFVVFEAAALAKESQPKKKKQKEKPYARGWDEAWKGVAEEAEEERKKKRTEKSRGLHDPRPVEFSVRGTGKKLRGKEGKIVRLLKGGLEKTMERDDLARLVNPGVKMETARIRLNTTARRANKSLIGSGLSIEVRRVYEINKTFYILNERKPRKKR